MEGVQESVRKKVCIVDDDQDILAMYKMRFEQEGYEVVTAMDGEAGLALIRSVDPDIVLLDLQMPKVDGVGVLDILNQDPKLMVIPVIVLSNNNTDQMFEKISNLGTVRYYIVKALTTPQKVIDIVAGVFSGDSTVE